MDRDRLEQYEDVKLDFAKEYMKPENSVGEDCRLLVNQIKITLVLLADKKLLNLWLKELREEIQNIKADLSIWNFD